MDSDDVLSIGINQQGYEVSVRDPKITEQNNDPKKPYKNPIIEYVFMDIDQVFKFVTDVLPTLKAESPESTFDAAYKRAVAESSSND